ncbi:hypothetical protein HV213_03430 [Klebsiella sp. RHBSTW-00484]|uniref:hypothetical protein n=1 Tax=unclassified Klebsiella TaxID=2608929 RepID=UPI0015E49C97|nr:MULTISPECIES: hypothetical protein [unclassified Klebsiella]MBA7845054.1 hypothetical protein [Klebsiella sp. RHBSTW-00465]QLO34966.1 hypothetical protein HV213_03430 [Klebsiella sp. RHBSTW-00484]QLT74479.1 hypothetical protein HV204_03430 [Klebsiella sp. RHBSTW-00464]
MTNQPYALCPHSCQVAAGALPDLQNHRAIPAEPESKNPRHFWQGFYGKLKLTVKPLSFRYSVVDSHSSAFASAWSLKAKTPAISDEGFLKS